MIASRSLHDHLHSFVVISLHFQIGYTAIPLGRPDGVVPQEILDRREIRVRIQHLRGQRHISKRGRSYLRKLLFFVAINTIRTNGIMHGHYRKMIDKGKPKVKAVVAISRKLLRIIFAMVRNHTTYEENYEKQYQEKLAA